MTPSINGTTNAPWRNEEGLQARRAPLPASRKLRMKGLESFSTSDIQREGKRRRKRVRQAEKKMQTRLEKEISQQWEDMDKDDDGAGHTDRARRIDDNLP